MVELNTKYIKDPQYRTSKQNRALHKYCTEVANLLNENGISHEVFYRNIQADYTMESIKELWRSFAKIQYAKTSTTELTSKEINAIYEEVNRHLAQFGVHIPFPSQEDTDSYINSFNK